MKHIGTQTKGIYNILRRIFGNKKMRIVSSKDFVMSKFIFLRFT